MSATNADSTENKHTEAQLAYLASIVTSSNDAMISEGVDGIEVLARLRAAPETATIPVVVLTSSHEERDLVETYNLGINSYIVKPVDFEQFTHAVRQIGFYWLLLNQVPSQNSSNRDYGASSHAA